MTVTVVDGDLPQDAATALKATGRIAVDTETSGLNWATDRLHLCQIYAPGVGAYLVRNVTGTPKTLGTLFADPQVVKIFHFAPFDLRFLTAQWDVRAVSIQCTKTASRLLDPQLPTKDHSLQPLLARHLNIHIQKGAVRTSDWGAHLLTDEQIAYAVGDVQHLPDLASSLESRLRDTGKWELFNQICQYMPVDAHLKATGTPDPLTY